MPDVRAYGHLGEVVDALLKDVTVEGVSAVVTDSASVGSNFGKGRSASREIRPYGFRLNDPLTCILDWPARPVNETYLYANIVWTLRGADDVASIAYYNDRASAFSADGSFMESAWGPKIFGDLGAGKSQFTAAVERLRVDPGSRRAAIDLMTASELVENRLDVSCAFAIHFFVRGGRLEALTTMRSQSAIGVMPYDIPLMVAVQAVAAAELRLPLGQYVHYANSMHIYEDELDRVMSAALEPPRTKSLAAPGSLASLQPLFEAEKTLRELALAGASTSKYSHTAKMLRSDLESDPFSIHAYELFEAWGMSRLTGAAPSFSPR